MGLLRDWWDRLNGGRDEPPHAKAPELKRPVRPSLPAQSAGTLELQDRPAAPRDRGHGQSGFDPYGNDAGFAKPHSWEHIDHD